jgi:hypothetical protein
MSSANRWAFSRLTLILPPNVGVKPDQVVNRGAPVVGFELGSYVQERVATPLVLLWCLRHNTVSIRGGFNALDTSVVVAPAHTR